MKKDQIITNIGGQLPRSLSSNEIARSLLSLEISAIWNWSRACTAAFPWPSITGTLLAKQRLKDQIKKTEISNTENTYHLLWAKNIPCLNARSSKKGKTTTAYRVKLVLVEMALLVASRPLNARVVVYQRRSWTSTVLFGMHSKLVIN